MDNNIILNLTGRLGNNLFQLSAAYEYLSKVNGNLLLTFDKQYENYIKSYPIIKNFQEYQGVCHCVIFNDNPYQYNEIPILNNKNIYLTGWFESEFYFPNDMFLKKYLNIPIDVQTVIKDLYPNIENSVGISVRRGDYLLYNTIFYVPKIEWYTDMYHKYFEGKPAIIFSDDIEWCEAKLEKNDNFIFHKPSHSSQDIYLIDDPMLNLYTMSMCRNHICSDSTWAWWGCKINEKQDAINIFPDKRFKNGWKESRYIPERWIKEKSYYE